MREARTMGRPRQFDETEVLDAVMAVFWARGFDGTSMSDLVAATGLKKGSLYAAFGDKRTMYRRALAHYDRTRIGGTLEALEGAGTPRVRIERFLEAAAGLRARAGGDKGCFLCNASIDQAPVDPGARQLVQASLGRLEAALAGLLADRGEERARRRARHLMSVYFGLRVLAKAGADRKTLDDAKQAALDVLTEA